MSEQIDKFTLETAYELSCDFIDHPPPVLTKKDFVRRYALGEFGNCAPTWDSYKEWREDIQWSLKLGQLFHIRNRIAGGLTWYDVEYDDMLFSWCNACDLVGKDNLYISAMCPTEKTVLQGEVMQTEKGLYLFYTQVAKPMREALAEQSYHATGICAKMLLEKFLDANSIDWLNWLLTAYPSHVIEFSTFSVKWGTVPGYNTVFWEVRNY